MAASLVDGQLGHASTEKRVALVIGNSRYDFQPELPNAVNDATAIAKVFRLLNFQVVIEATDLKTKSAFDKPIAQFHQSLDGAHVGVLFYAGHAVQIADRVYLLPLEVERPNNEGVLKRSSVLLNDIQTEMHETRMDNPPISIVFLDACRSAVEFERTRSLGGAGSLTQLNAPADSFIGYATGPGEKAKDGFKGGDHSPFTTSLLKEIQAEGVSLADMMAHVSRRVAELTAGVQRAEHLSKLSSPFYFRPPDEGQARWREIERFTDARVFDKFVERFPNHSRARDAGFRATALRCEKEDWDRIQQSTDPVLFKAFMDKYRTLNGEYHSKAEQKWSQLVSQGPVTVDKFKEDIKRTASQAKTAARTGVQLGKLKLTAIGGVVMTGFVVGAKFLVPKLAVGAFFACVLRLSPCTDAVKILLGEPDRPQYPSGELLRRTPLDAAKSWNLCVFVRDRTSCNSRADCYWGSVVDSCLQR